MQLQSVTVSVCSHLSTIKHNVTNKEYKGHTCPQAQTKSQTHLKLNIFNIQKTNDLCYPVWIHLSSKARPYRGGVTSNTSGWALNTHSIYARGEECLMCVKEV